MFNQLSAAKRKGVVFGVACCVALGLFIGMRQPAHATLTPGFGASGTWGCPGGSGTVVIDSTPIVQTPIGAPTPGFGITG
jgi:hypothetical protein